MSNGPYATLEDLDRQIATARENIRQLTEQATAQSGAADEDLNADRIAEQQDELDRLRKLREELAKKV
jgi:hypothetical protein